MVLQDHMTNYKTIYIYYHSPYDHQAGQDDELHWAAPTHKTTRPFSQVVVKDHLAN